MTFGEEVKQAIAANEALATNIHKKFRDLLKEIKTNDVSAENQSVFQIKLRAVIDGYTIEIPYTDVVAALTAESKPISSITAEQIDAYLKQLILSKIA